MLASAVVDGGYRLESCCGNGYLYRGDKMKKKNPRMAIPETSEPRQPAGPGRTGGDHASKAADRGRAETLPLDSGDALKALIDWIPVGILLTSTEGAVLNANQAFLDIAGGYSMEELLRTPVSSLYVDPTDRERILKSLLEDGSIHDFETRVNIKGGKILWISISSVVGVTPSGRKMIISAIQDIGERKQAEEALRESEEMYRTLVDTSPDAIIVSGVDATITNVSGGAVGMFGYQSPDEMVGRNVFELFAPEERERAINNRKLRYESSAPRYVEYTMLRKDGARFGVELSASVFHDSTGNPLGIIGVARDITERKRAEEQLKKMNAELDAFAHSVSHDLRGPLASLFGANKTLQLLMRDPDIEGFRSNILEMTGIIDTSTARAEKLIGDVLSLAETAQVPEEVSEVDVSEIVEEIIEERVVDIQERGIELRAGKELGTVVANRTHVYQIFSNLIGNAIQHNDNARPTVEIEHLGDDGEGGHRYLVRDNGSGIPPQDLERIFIPFFRGKSGATGIGLSTVEKILKVYGGDIKARNDNGTCFEFLIKDFGRE
jgi:PAS domain S-box-containing protein